MRFIKPITLFLLAIVLLNACKKGCTNSKALNYKKSAQEEDGTCEFCDSIAYLGGNSSAYIYDNNTGSPYQGSSVAYIGISNYYVQGTGNACAKYGITNKFKYQKYVIRNNVSQTMTISFRINIMDSHSSTYVDVPPLTIYGYNTIDLAQMTYLVTSSYQPYVDFSNVVISYQ